MKFGTTTHIKLENQMVKGVEPTLKVAIIGAPQKAIKAFVAQIPNDGKLEDITLKDIDGNNLTVYPVYVALYGKVRGEANKELLWQSDKVLVGDSNWERIAQTVFAMGGKDLLSGLGNGVSIAAGKLTVSPAATYRMIHEYVAGSSVRIVEGEGADYYLNSIPAPVLSYMRDKNIIAMYEDDGEVAFSPCVEQEDGAWKVLDASAASSKVAIMENPFNIVPSSGPGSTAPHGTFFIDYVYADAGIAGEAYYIEEMEQLKEIFGNGALTLGPGGAGYNAYLHMSANGSKNGFYVYCPAFDDTNPAKLYLSSAQIQTALDEFKKYTDVYDIVAITHDWEAQTVIGAHISAMSEPEERKERRGYVGTYLEPETSGIYKDLPEFEIMCSVGQEGAKHYLKNRYGTKTGYINAVMMKNTYNDPRMTVLETKWGIVGDKYVTASTLLAIYVGIRNTYMPGYVMAKEALSDVSDVSFAGLFNDIDHMDKLQNAGVMTIWKATEMSPVRVYYPCTASPDNPQLAEEYNVISTDMFARECREALLPHIGCGTENKISENIKDIKSVRYVNKVRQFLDTTFYKYRDIFAKAELRDIRMNPSYQGAILIVVAIQYTYAVQSIEVIIYI